MATEAIKNRGREEQDDGIVGFATLDDRGRVALSKATRRALGLTSGSPIAYVVLGDAVLLVPQDEHLTQLSEHATRILEKAGLTVNELLDELPAARGEIMREEYGDEFMDALEREHAARRGITRATQP